MTYIPDISDLPAYFSEIEEAFCSRRNSPLLLSPLDFEKVAGWHAAGIPVNVVRDGISRYFDKLDKRKTPLRKAICISFAEDCVLKAFDEYRQAMIGSRCGIEGTSGDGNARKENFLRHLSEKLEAFLGNVDLSVPRLDSRALASAILNMIKRLSADEKLSLVDIENRLSPLDSELGKVLLSETSPEIIDKWRSESRERLRKAGIAPDDAIAAAAEKNILLNRIFRFLDIPRLSILYYDE